MSKPISRAYSRQTRAAAALLGGLIREARTERRLTMQEVADRAGISRGMLRRIEKGDLKCELGAVLEVASLVGVALFDADEPTLAGHLSRTQGKLALLPKSVRKKSGDAYDDF